MYDRFRPGASLPFGILFRLTLGRKLLLSFTGTLRRPLSECLLPSEGRELAHFLMLGSLSPDVLQHGSDGVLCPEARRVLWQDSVL